MILRVYATAVLFILALIPTFWYYGPIIESQFLPVADVEPIDVKYSSINYEGIDRSVMLFKLRSIKHRPCYLENFTFRWLLGTDVTVTPVFIRADNLPFQSGAALLGGEAITQELWTFIPTAAFNYVGSVEFRGTGYYRCHPMWPLTTRFSYTVKIPNVQEQKQQGILRDQEQRRLMAQRRRYTR